jgi:ATP-dependent RNA helicase RhlE
MSFEDLGLSADIIRAVSHQGYSEPTPIQIKAIPSVLMGLDILAGAQTGTGKTAGFILPILQILSQNNYKKSHRPIRALVITPTRELAAQISDNTINYSKYLKIKSTVVFGGVKINPQIAKLRSGIDILVATPGRLLDHSKQKTLDLSEIEILVLDEADRMLDMGFLPDIKKILYLLPKNRQNLLFSATFTDDIKRLADTLLNKPKHIETTQGNATAERIKQFVHFVNKARKRELLSFLIGSKNWQQVLVFTRTKHGANRLAKQLAIDGLKSAAIHGNKSQAARTKALADFKEGDVRVLVATDIAARGLDISQLPHVVNFELPKIPGDYIHRIGRTGRAGNEGEAISLVSEDEYKSLKNIEHLLGINIPKKYIHGFSSEPLKKILPLDRGLKKKNTSNKYQKRKIDTKNVWGRIPKKDRGNKNK